MYKNEIVKLYIQKDLKLVALFNDETFRELDFNKVIDKYPEYAELKKNNLFNKAKVKANFFIIWNENLDFLADTFYEMSHVVEFNESKTLPLIGYKIMKARLSQDMSQQKLSKLTGIKQCELSKIENGLINITVNNLEKILSALHLTLNICN